MNRFLILLVTIIGICFAPEGHSDTYQQHIQSGINRALTIVQNAANHCRSRNRAQRSSYARLADVIRNAPVTTYWNYGDHRMCRPGIGAFTSKNRQSETFGRIFLCWPAMYDAGFQDTLSVAQLVIHEAWHIYDPSFSECQTAANEVATMLTGHGSYYRTAFTDHCSIQGRAACF